MHIKTDDVRAVANWLQSQSTELRRRADAADKSGIDAIELGSVAYDLQTVGLTLHGESGISLQEALEE